MTNDYEIGSPIKILMMEDSPDDVFFTKEALRETKMRVNLNVVTNGMDGMAYLKKEGKYADVETPDLILLDLNMPIMDGREVLALIKQDPRMRLIPVVVLTTSQAEEDVLQAYDLHANCYVSKPVDLDKFVRVVNSIENFWMTVVKLPNFSNSR